MEMSFVCIGSSNSNFQICPYLGSEKQPQLLGNFPSVKATFENVSRIYDLSFLSTVPPVIIAFCYLKNSYYIFFSI